MTRRTRTSNAEAIHIVTELRKLIKSAPEEQRDLPMYQAFSRACFSSRDIVEIVDKLKETLDWAKINDAVLVSPRVWHRMTMYGAETQLRNRKLVSYFAFLKEEELHKFFQDSGFLSTHAVAATEIDWNDKKMKFYDFDWSEEEKHEG